MGVLSARLDSCGGALITAWAMLGMLLLVIEACIINPTSPKP